MPQSTANTEEIQGAKFQHLGFPTLGNPDAGIPAVGISEVGINKTKDINKPELLINNNILNQTEFNSVRPVCHSSKGTGRDRQELKNDYIDLIKDQVDYEHLIQSFSEDKDTIDGIINVITDIATTNPENGYERINGRDYPHEVVKSRLLKMDYNTMLHVLDKLKENTTKIRNLRAYMLTVLYNAKDEMELSVMNQVNYDMYGGGWEEKGII